MCISIIVNYSETTLEYLQDLGHVTETDNFFAVIQQVMVDSITRNVSAHSDQRKQGESYTTNIS